VRRRFENPESRVSFQRIDTPSTALSFRQNRTEIEAKQAEVLDAFGEQLQEFASLRAEIDVGADSSEREGVTEERGRAIATYLSEKWSVAPERIDLKSDALSRRQALLRFRNGESSSNGQ
jgi:hypothetical protein